VHISILLTGVAVFAVGVAAGFVVPAWNARHSRPRAAAGDSEHAVRGSHRMTILDGNHH